VCTGAISVLATIAVLESAPLTDKREYMIPLAIQVAWPIFLILITLFLTESPIWLLSKGRIAEAKINLMKLRRDNEEVVDAELAIQSVALKQSEELRNSVRWLDIFNRQNIERTLMAGFLGSASQVGGQIVRIANFL
jgi:hypothetical protein